MKHILIVVDMQNDFLSGALGSESCRNAIPYVADLIKSRNWDRVVLTLDTHETEDYLDTLEGRMIPRLHCIKHTEGHKICPEVVDAVNEMSHLDSIPTDKDVFGLVEKDTFGSKDLTVRLRGDACMYGQENMEIHICGVCTSICVLANAVMIRAALPNSRIVVHESACGDVSVKRHKAAIECLKAQLCEVVD